MATCLRSDLFPQSLRGLLRQTYEPLEVVVLVDGGDAASVKILEQCSDPRVRWFTTDRPSGMARAWNTVCEQAHGKYMLFCADDDLLLAHAIDAQVELLERNPNVAFCHADFDFIDDDGRVIGQWRSHRGQFIDRGFDAWPNYLVQTLACMQTTVIRRSDWLAVGGWDEDAGNPADNSLYLKLLGRADVGHVSIVACQYRIRTHRPDTWKKKFSNWREYHALASKHLRNPPPNVVVAPSVLRTSLARRLTLATIPLLRAAPTRKDRETAASWLGDNIWPFTRAGAIVARAERCGLTLLIQLFVQVEQRLRMMVKSMVLLARRVLP